MSAHYASWGKDVTRPGYIMRLSQLWWAVRVGVWLCGLPIHWRVYSLPDLLQRLTPVRGRGPCPSQLELDRAVRIVRRICRLRLFHGPLFPHAYLRQASALYYVLAQLGYPAEIHFGIYKVGGTLRGHSWVTLDGKPVAERLPPETLPTIYSCPAAVSRMSRV